MDTQELLREVITRVVKNMAANGMEYNVDELAAKTKEILEGKAAASAEAVVPTTPVASVAVPVVPPAALEKSTIYKLCTDQVCDAGVFLETAAILQKYQVIPVTEPVQNTEEADILIVTGLSNLALGKLGAGIGDNPATATIVHALAKGKKVFAIQEGIELFFCPDMARAYYMMYKDKLDLLARSGLVIVPGKELERKLNIGASNLKTLYQTNPKTPLANGVKYYAPAPERELQAEPLVHVKRVLTETDVRVAAKNGYTAIQISENTILTHMAKDAAKVKGITLIMG